MEKNLPSHQIDRYNLSAAQRRPGLLAFGGATEQPVWCRSLPAQTKIWEEDGGNKPKPFHRTEGIQKEIGRVQIWGPAPALSSPRACPQTRLVLI